MKMVKGDGKWALQHDLFSFAIDGGVRKKTIQLEAPK
jgi:hypothetical protein